MIDTSSQLEIGKQGAGGVREKHGKHLLEGLTLVCEEGLSM